MARELGTGASTAYAAQRYAPRPTRTTAPVGQQMSAKQREFLSALVIETAKNAGQQIRLLEPVDGKYSAADIASFADAVDSPAAIVANVQAQLNRTDIGARDLIDSHISARDASRVSLRSAQAKAPRAASQSPVQDITDGEAYRAADGRVFRAYRTQAGHLCLKLWNVDTSSFEFFGGVKRAPAGLEQLSVEESREFGRATGTCIRCMRHLTDDESVRNGIGPICASRL